VASISFDRTSSVIESAGQLVNFLTRHHLRIEALVTPQGQPAPGSPWRIVLTTDDSKMEPVVLFAKGTVTHGRIRLADLLTWSAALPAASDAALRKVLTAFDQPPMTAKFNLVAHRPVLLPFHDLEVVMRPSRDARNYAVGVMATASPSGPVGATVIMSMVISTAVNGQTQRLTRSFFVPTSAGVGVVLDSSSYAIETEYVTGKGATRRGGVALHIEVYRPELVKLA
jgi:hypothetical protein